MPIHLPPISRRRFLAGSLAAAAATVIGRRGWAADSAKIDASRVALWSDTHLSADTAKVQRDVNMWEHFEKSSADMFAQEKLPSMVLVNGDLALDAGLPGDYEVFTAGVKKFREAGLPVHLNLGNHDHRENFWKALPAADANKVVEGKHVSVVETLAVNWIMLDSLEITKATPGLLGPAQLDWLANAIDARKDKPAVVIVHHNPIVVPPTPPAATPAPAATPKANGKPAPATGPAKVSGLKDAKALLALLLPKTQVKAVVFGHTHKYVYTKEEGLHLINLPAVAYPFAKGDPTGWVDCAVKEGGAKFTLRTTDQKHPLMGDVKELRWR
jgi:3',5'-cyclic-AMP phosphodiesterase